MEISGRQPPVSEIRIRESGWKRKRIGKLLLSDPFFFSRVTLQAGQKCPDARPPKS
jgi:hypothetical protein